MVTFIHCTALHCTAMPYSTTAPHYSYDRAYSNAVQCNVAQLHAVQRNAKQSKEMQCNAKQRIAMQRLAKQCEAMQSAAKARLCSARRACVRVCVREAPVTTHVSMFACTCVREAPVTTHVRVRVCVRASVREAPVTTHVCVRVWLCLFTYVCVRRLSRPACVCACVCVCVCSLGVHTVCPLTRQYSSFILFHTPVIYFEGPPGG